jgi:hypothetical protein
MNKGKFLMFCRDFDLIYNRFHCPKGIQKKALDDLYRKVNNFEE